MLPKLLQLFFLLWVYFQKMDYDDELRRSCEKTGDLLHKRKKAEKCSLSEEMDEFEAEMETELDQIYSNATSNWSGTNDVQPGPSGLSVEEPNQTKQDYDKGIGMKIC